MQINDVVLGLAAGVGIDLSPDGRTAYYVEWSIGELSTVDVTNGQVATLLRGLSYPQDVKVDWDTGEIFVSERTGRIGRVTPHEISSPIADPGGSPQQLAYTKNGSQRFLYTVGYDSGELIQIDPDARTMTVLTRGLGHPVGIVVDQLQDVAYVTEQDTGQITRVDLTTGSTSPICAGLTAPFYLAWDRSTTGVYCVQRDPANSLVHVALQPGSTPVLVADGLAWRPSGVAPASDDSLIFVCSDRELEVISFNGGPTVSLPPPPFVIESIEFNVDGGDALRLKHHESGSFVPVPEYVAGVRNEPAAFVGGATPTIRVVLRQRPGYVNAPYAIGATGSLGGVRRQEVAPNFHPSGLSDPIMFQLMWPIPGMVGKFDVSLDWYARTATSPSVPTPIGSDSHRIYTVLGRPTAPWDSEPPWVAALELACGWATGSRDTDAAAALITERYNASGKVSYDTIAGRTMYGFVTFSLSEMIERLNGGIGLGEKVNCTDCANTVSSLSNILGCDLWQSRMTSATGFALNPIVAIGYNIWAIPFLGSFSYHEVAWKGACTAADNIFDGCLHVDGDANPQTDPHTPLLPRNALFGDCTTLNYRLRLSPPGANGCSACAPAPTTRQRRPVS